MQGKSLKSILYLLVTLAFGNQLLAIVNSSCKKNCISQKSEEVKKHRCCPQMSSKTVCPEKISQKCVNCLENREAPEQNVEKTDLAQVEPNSISELEIGPVFSLQHKKASSYISPPLSHPSLPITLHRFLI